MALAALAGDDARGRELAALLQHRLGGPASLAGHAVGNLMLCGLIEMQVGDTSRALDEVGELLGCAAGCCRWPTSRWTSWREVEASTPTTRSAGA